MLPFPDACMKWTGCHKVKFSCSPAAACMPAPTSPQVPRNPLLKRAAGSQRGSWKCSSFLIPVRGGGGQCKVEGCGGHRAACTTTSGTPHRATQAKMQEAFSFRLHAATLHAGMSTCLRPALRTGTLKGNCCPPPICSLFPISFPIFLYIGFILTFKWKQAFTHLFKATHPSIWFILYIITYCPAVSQFLNVSAVDGWWRWCMKQKQSQSCKDFERLRITKNIVLTKHRHRHQEAVTSSNLALPLRSHLLICCSCTNDLCVLRVQRKQPSTKTILIFHHLKRHFSDEVIKIGSNALERTRLST